jgi:hypothetical protein
LPPRKSLSNACFKELNIFIKLDGKIARQKRQIKGQNRDETAGPMLSHDHKLSRERHRMKNRRNT